MKPIYISSDDHRRLKGTVSDLVRSGARVSDSVKKLKEELERAVVLNPLAIPPDVVVLHSRVDLRDLGTGDLEEWVLTMPEHADPENQRLSVLAPIGTAILGFAEGDEIEWETPGGIRRIKIERVRPGAPISPAFPKSIFG
jgi:regulator of nucleoside diphosphate kinase